MRTLGTNYIKLFEEYHSNFLYRFIDCNWFINTLQMNDLPANIMGFDYDLLDKIIDKKLLVKYQHFKGKFFISFTRDSKFNMKPIKVTFDKDMLSKKYQFFPISYFTIVDNEPKEEYTQSEERLILNAGQKVKNWKSYIIKVEILSSKLKDESIIENIQSLCIKNNIECKII